MSQDLPSGASLRERAVRELREFAATAIYLYVCFASLLFLKAAILQADGISYAHFGTAALKAVICAKFILLGRAFHVGTRFRTRSLIWETVSLSVAFLALLIVLTAIEETIVGFIHHRPMAESLAAIGGGTLEQFLATSLIQLLILVPYFAILSLAETLGPGTLARLFLAPHPEMPSGAHRMTADPGGAMKADRS
jgi:hypothetical protein